MGNGIEAYLVVDDMPLNAKILKLLLQKERPNAVIEVAHSGSVAIKKLDQMLHAGLTFDAIFMDFNMPIMDGNETFIKMEQNSVEKYGRTLKELEIRQIFVTANGELKTKDVKEDCEVFYKPVLKEDISKMLS